MIGSRCRITLHDLSAAKTLFGMFSSPGPGMSAGIEESRLKKKWFNLNVFPESKPGLPANLAAKSARL